MSTKVAALRKLIPLLIIIAAATILIIAAYLIYKEQTKIAFQKKYNKLAEVGNSKASQISRWLNERKSDATFLSRNSNFPQEIEYYLNSGKFDTAHVLSHLEYTVKDHRFSNIIIVNKDKSVVYSIVPNNNQLEKQTLSCLDLSFSFGNLCVTDFISSNKTYFDITTPIVAEGKVVAGMVLRLDPKIFLLPLLSEGLVSVESFEAILVDKTEESILVLKSSNHTKDSQEIFTVNAQNPSCPAIQAISGKEGIFKGLSLDNEAILSDLRHVAGTPWFMVVTMSEKEIMKELNNRTFLFAISLLLVIMVVIVSFTIDRIRRQRAINLQITNQERKLANLVETLKFAKNKAEESDRLKTAFLANMSHEIRTPMNGILGFLDLLKEPNLDEKNRSEYIELVNMSGERLLNTINDIIELSKIESGEVSVKLENFSLEDLMNFYIGFFKPQTLHKNIRLFIGTQITAEASYIQSDKKKIDGIMINLIKNAVKFTRTGEIEIGNYLEENKLCIYVRDTGIGIPSHRMNAIFQRFVQADLNFTNEYEGSGLGLSIVKAYTDALEGAVYVESEEGIGSKFTVKIPYVISSETKNPVTEFLKVH